MIERLYFDHPHVYGLADCDLHDGGRVLHVVCEDSGAATYAAQLAIRLNAPLRPRPEPRHEPAAQNKAAL